MITPNTAALIAQVSVVLLLVGLFERRGRARTYGGHLLLNMAYNLLALANLVLIGVSILVVLSNAALTGPLAVTYLIYLAACYALICSIYLARTWRIPPHTHAPEHAGDEDQTAD